jgi:hypothetical protein
VRRRALAVTLRVLLFTVIGAAATVLVAWGAIVVRHDSLRSQMSGVAFDLSSYGSSITGERHYRGRGLRTERSVTFGTTLEDVLECRAGLPLLAVAGRSRHLSNTKRGFVIPTFAQPGDSNGIPLPLKPLKPVAEFVPILPLWPGFLVDTAFWGGAAFLVWSVPGLVRRGMRRRRGRCVRCGYELKDLAVCPECGHSEEPQRGSGL